MLRRTVQSLPDPKVEIRALTPAAIAQLVRLQERVARRLASGSSAPSESEMEHSTEEEP